MSDNEVEFYFCESCKEVVPRSYYDEHKDTLSTPRPATLQEVLQWRKEQGVEFYFCGQCRKVLNRTERDEHASKFFIGGPCELPRPATLQEVLRWKRDGGKRA